MNKSFSISLGGLAFIVEDDAYESLKQYLNSIRLSLNNDESTEEIIQDVEHRIAELFKEKLGNNRQVVSTQDIDYAKSIMGSPQDFASEDEAIAEPQYAKLTSNYSTGKQLFRDTDKKILGGVCAGIANYFGINAIIVRLLFLLPILPFIFDFGISLSTSILLYIILWIVLPQAKTTADKLKMQGKPVNFDNIKQYVNIDNEEVKENINKASNALKTGTSGLGDFLEGFFKVFGKILLIGMGILLIGSGIVAIILFFTVIIPWNIGEFNSYELGMFVFDEKWMLYTGILLIGLVMIIPAFYLITLGLRLISDRIQLKFSNTVIISSVFVWFFSLFALITLGIYTASNFSYGEISKSNKYTLTSISDTLTVYYDELNQDKNYKYNNRNTHINRIDGFSKDGKNYLFNLDNKLEVGVSTNPNFILEVNYESRGKNESDAKQNLETIQYEFKNLSNELVLNKYMAIAKDKKYRFQKVKLKLLVPKGKYIKTKNINWVYNIADGFDDDYYIDKDSNNLYNLFTFHGSFLECITCEKKFKNYHDDENDDEQYNYSHDKDIDSLSKELSNKVKSQVKKKLKEAIDKIDSTDINIE